jgi:hypothetical protein
MKGCFLPDYNIALQFTNKTGSLQMINTFMLFFNYYNIKYEGLDTSFNIFDENTKFYIFTRNPINRFITTYNWFMHSSDRVDGVLNLKQKYNITDMESYINNYNNIMYEIDNTHYQPQIFEILQFNENNFNIDLKSIKDSLFKKYNTNYTFLNIEMISTFLKNFTDTYQYSHGNLLDLSLPKTDYECKLILDLIPEFVSMDIESKKHFNFLYLAIKSILDKTHHHTNSRIELDTPKLRSIIGKIPIIKIEAELYGYFLPKRLI